MNPEERKLALDALAAEVATCTRCPLHKQRTKAVPGEGDPNTEVVFVGEGPGFNEDREGRPFVGQAGGLLNELLTKIGWRRRDVFITNVVKCRPPSNRDPEPHEIAACAPYLQRQLELLDPAVVVTLGRHSLQTFMPGARISQAHGTTSPTPPETGAVNATTYAMYHPAAALRQHSLKETMLVDMCGLPDVLLESRARRAQATAADAMAEPDPVGVAAVALAAVAPAPVAIPVEPMAEPFPVDPAPLALEPAPLPVEPAPLPAPDALIATIAEPLPEPIPEPVAVIATGPHEPQLELFG